MGFGRRVASVQRGCGVTAPVSPTHLCLSKQSSPKAWELFLSHSGFPRMDVWAESTFPIDVGSSFFG